MGDNPFADPFADPSVTSAASSASGGAYGDTFNNPFEGQQRANNTGGAYGKKNDKTALLPKRSQDVEMKARSPTHAAASTSSGLSEEDLRIREANLIRREQELAERERQVEELARQNGGNSKKDNWPSRCYPLVYHSIVDEIPEAQRTLVRQFYASMFFVWMCIFWNWLTMLIGWGSSIDDISGSDALWASVYLLGIPGSWRFWYRSLYFAIRDRATGKWVVFFLSFLMHIGFTIVMGLGVPSCAAAGLFLMIKLFANSHSLLGIFCLVAMIIWGLSALFSFFLLKRAHSLWKSGGGAAQLKKEVAKAAVTEAVNQKMAESGGTEEV